MDRNKITCLDPKSIRCSWGSDYYCSGRYEANKHDDKCPIWTGKECDCSVKSLTWVAAHRLPVWVQCSGCGEAPSTSEEQAQLLGKVLFGGNKKESKK